MYVASIYHLIGVVLSSDISYNSFNVIIISGIVVSLRTESHYDHEQMGVFACLLCQQVSNIIIWILNTVFPSGISFYIKDMYRPGLRDASWTVRNLR